MGYRKNKFGGAVTARALHAAGLALLLIMPNLAAALGLDRIDVRSGLNEPLDGEIGIVYSDPSELDGLTATLAGEADFRRVGLDRMTLTTPLEFRIGEDSNGQPVILVSTRQPVREPFLSFLIELNWPQGRLLREYTVLLDPPIASPASAYAGGTVTTAPAPLATVEEPNVVYVEDDNPDSAFDDTPAVTLAPGAAADPEVDAYVDVDSDIDYGASTADFGGSNYTVRSGDTLWEIASAQAPADAGLTINQMMIALLRNNPGAFYEDNVNALKTGEILRVPARDEVSAIRYEDALAEVRTHNEIWDGYQAQSSFDVPTVAESSADFGATDTGDALAVRDDRLELIPPRDDEGDDFNAIQTGSGSFADNTGLRDELNRAQEELASSAQENRELSSRVQELESLVDQLERAIELRDADLADLQDRMADDGADPIMTDDPFAAGFEDDPVDAMDSDPFADDGFADDGFGTDAFADSDGDAVAAADDPFAADALTEDPFADDAFATDAADDPFASNDFDTADDPFAADSSDPFADDMASDPFADDSSADDPFADAASDDPFADEFADGAVSDADTAPVDADMTDEPAAPTPAATEAESAGLPWMLIGIGAGMLLLLIAVILFFVRRNNGADADAPGDQFERVDDEQDAEAELIARIEENPDDTPARMALLRRYYAAEQSAEFHAEAAALKARLDDPDEDVNWREARSMGQSIDDNHELYAYAAVADEDDDHMTTADDLGLGENFAATDDDDLGIDLDEMTAIDDAENEVTKRRDGPIIDLDDNAPPVAADEDDDDLDFDLDLDADEQPTVERTVAPPPPGATAAAASADDDDDLDFDLDFDLDESPTVEREVSEDMKVEEAASDELSFDLGDDDLDLDLDDTAAADDDVALDLEGDDDVELDLDADDAIELTESVSAAETTSEVVQDDGDAGVDLDDLDLFDSDDTVATKLDLARAYIDMGDPDGARSMLEEVKEEGNDEQRAEADRLLDDL